MGCPWGIAGSSCLQPVPAAAVLGISRIDAPRPAGTPRPAATGTGLRLGVAASGGPGGIAVVARVSNRTGAPVRLRPDRCGRVTHVTIARIRPRPAGRAWSGSAGALKRLVLRRQRARDVPAELLVPRSELLADRDLCVSRHPAVAIPPGGYRDERWEVRAPTPVEAIGVGNAAIRVRLADGRAAPRLERPAAELMDAPGRGSEAGTPSPAQQLDRLLAIPALRAWVERRRPGSWRDAGVDPDGTGRIRLRAITAEFERALLVTARPDGSDARVMLPGSRDRARRFTPRPVELPAGVPLIDEPKGFAATRELEVGRLLLPSGRLVLDAYFFGDTEPQDQRATPGAKPVRIPLARYVPGGGGDSVALATVVAGRAARSRGVASAASPSTAGRPGSPRPRRPRGSPTRRQRTATAGSSGRSTHWRRTAGSPPRWTPGGRRRGSSSAPGSATARIRSTPGSTRAGGRRGSSWTAGCCTSRGNARARRAEAAQAPVTRRSSRRAIVSLWTSSGPSARRSVRMCAYMRGEREVVGHAAAAVDLDRAVDDLQRDVGAATLIAAISVRACRLPTRVHQPGGLQRQQARHLDLDPRLGDPVLDVGALGETGLPNVTRSRRRGGTCSSSARSAAPIARMQWWMRPGPSRAWAIRKPSPSPAMMFSAGHAHVARSAISRVALGVLVAEHRQRRARSSRPGVSSGTRTIDCWRWRGAVRVGLAHHDQDPAVRVQRAGRSTTCGR